MSTIRLFTFFASVLCSATSKQHLGSSFIVQLPRLCGDTSASTEHAKRTKASTEAPRRPFGPWSCRAHTHQPSARFASLSHMHVCTRCPPSFPAHFFFFFFFLSSASPALRSSCSLYQWILPLSFFFFSFPYVTSATASRGGVKAISCAPSHSTRSSRSFCVAFESDGNTF